MRGGFRIRKKQLKLAGWQIVGESKGADGQYQLILQHSNGEKVTIKSSTRAKARGLGPKSERDGGRNSLQWQR